MQQILNEARGKVGHATDSTTCLDLAWWQRKLQARKRYEKKLSAAVDKHWRQDCVNFAILVSKTSKSWYFLQLPTSPLSCAAPQGPSKCSKMLQETHKKLKPGESYTHASLDSRSWAPLRAHLQSDLQLDAENSLGGWGGLLQPFTMATFSLLDFTPLKPTTNLAMTCLNRKITPKFSGKPSVAYFKMLPALQMRHES